MMTALIMMWRFLSKESKTGRLSVDMYQHQVHGFLVRRNEKTGICLLSKNISIVLKILFFITALPWQVYGGSSSVTYLVTFLSTPDIKMKQLHWVPLSVCCLTLPKVSLKLFQTEQCQSLYGTAPSSSYTTMCLGSSACLCSNALINMMDVFVFKLAYSTTQTNVWVQTE